MQLIGANAYPTVTGLDALPGTVNYFRGPDPTQWRSGVPTYQRVKYTGVYPGIDLLYYGQQRQLEYDFVVAPRADPQCITLGFSGAERLEVNDQGELIVHTGREAVRMHKPVVYQEIAGKRQEIAGRYVLRPDNHVGFALAAYDTSQPLTIDPVLEYATYLGGSGFDSPTAIAVDQQGHAYVTVYTQSIDLPTQNALQPDSGDVYIAKLSANGRQLLYSTYFGGSSDEYVSAIAVDQEGNAYLGGSTASTDFPTRQALQPACALDPDGVCQDAFIAKLNATGSRLLYSTFLGGSSGDGANGIAVDQEGNAYVGGGTASTDFPTRQALQPACALDPDDVCQDAFIVKLNAAGSRLLYSTYLGGSSTDEARSIAVDKKGHVYVIGRATSTDFPTRHALQPDCVPISEGFCESAFIAKLNATGSRLLYSTFLFLGSFGGNVIDIAVDEEGNAYVTGYTDWTDFPTHNALQPTCARNPKYDGCRDAFIIKVNTRGRLIYSTFLGGRGGDNANGIAVDREGNVYVTGFASSTNFPTRQALQPACALNPDGVCQDAFIAKLNATGSQLLYSTFLGGSGFDVLVDIAVDQEGNIYVAGVTRSTDFPTRHALQPTLSGDADAFVVKIRQ